MNVKDKFSCHINVRENPYGALIIRAFALPRNVFLTIVKTAAKTGARCVTASAAPAPTSARAATLTGAPGDAPDAQEVAPVRGDGNVQDGVREPVKREYLFFFMFSRT